MTRFLTVLIAAFAILISGCKPSVEGESQNWTTNVAKVKELTATYPGFKPALEARLKTAEAAHAKADGLADEAKAAQLQSANKTLMAGFVGQLKGVDSKLDKLRKKRVEAASKAGDESSRLAAKLAGEDAQKTVDRVEKVLKTGAKDEASANAVLKKVTKDIKTATDAVESVLKTDKAKKDTKAADKKAVDKKAVDTKKADEKKVAEWKCEYCGSMNKHDATKCESCAASKPAPKAAKK